LAVYPQATKTAYHTVEAMQHFCGPKGRIASFYCDKAPELVTPARACKWRLSTATTGMPQTNGVAERSVRTVKEGGGCGIVQSGFNAKTFWARSCRALMFSTNIATVYGDSCYDRRHKAGRFRGQRVLFGAYVDFMPQHDIKVVSMGAKQSPECLSVTTFTLEDDGLATTSSPTISPSGVIVMFSSRR